MRHVIYHQDQFFEENMMDFGIWPTWLGNLSKYRCDHMFYALFLSLNSTVIMIMMITLLRRTSNLLQISYQIVSTVILNYLIWQSSPQRRCENGCHGCSMDEEPVSSLVLFELCHNWLCLVKLCQLSASFVPCSLLAIPASSSISRFYSVTILYKSFCGVVLGGFSNYRGFVINCK